MVRCLIFALFWFALMWAALQMQNTDIGHSFCGRWGCGPPAEAILGMHFFWFAALLPPLLFLARVSPLPWKLGGKILVFAMVSALIGIGIFDFVGENRQYYEQGFVWQRYLLTIGTLVDFPVVQLLLAGIVLVVFGRGCPCCERQATDVAESDDVTGQLKRSGSD